MSRSRWQAAARRTLLVAMVAGAGGAGFADTLVLTGATIYDGAGKTFAPGMMVIRNGRIEAVGPAREVPATARVIDVSGKFVTPGLFALASQIGLVEIGAVDETVDGIVQEGPAASFSVTAAINVRSSLIGINRVEGVTGTLVAPAPGWDIIAGRGATLRLGPDLAAVEHPDVGLFVEIGSRGGRETGGSRAAALARLANAFDEARVFAEAQGKLGVRPYGQYAYGPADLRALADFLDGRGRLFVAAHRASDIRAAMALAGERRLPLVIMGGREAWRLRTELAAAKVGVVMNPLNNLPASFDELGARLDAPALLAEAGVAVAFRDEESHNARRLRQLAGNAVAHGMPWQTALAAITRVPASMAGQGRALGQLAAGMRADLVVWTGDPLEVTSWAERVFIDGVEVPRTTRQTRLRERYRHLADDRLPHAYR